MADCDASNTDSSIQIEALQRQLQAALQLAAAEKTKREKQFSEASAKIAKAEEELAKSKAHAIKLMSPRKRSSSDASDASDASATTTFLGCQMLRKTAKLILEDGKEFIGFSFGAERFAVSYYCSSSLYPTPILLMTQIHSQYRFRRDCLQHWYGRIP